MRSPLKTEMLRLRKSVEKASEIAEEWERAHVHPDGKDSPNNAQASKQIMLSSMLLGLAMAKRQLTAAQALNLQAIALSWLPESIQAKVQPAQPSHSALISKMSACFGSPDNWKTLGDTIYGDAYQLYRLPERRISQQRTQTADKKLSQSELSAFTQLYTPNYVIDYLLENTILPCCRPARVDEDGNVQRTERSGYAAQSSWHHTGTSSIQKDPTTITVLDPCCGSGHFLVRGYLLLYELLRKKGLDSEQASLQALSNLYGADIDVTGLWVTSFSLAVVASEHLRGRTDGIRLHLEDVSDRQLGSLSTSSETAGILNQKYTAIVTNPPYIGRKLMDRATKHTLKAAFPRAHSDLSAAFLCRGLELLEPGGRLGFITQAPLLYLPTYEDLRLWLLESYKPCSIIELGAGVFPLQSGEKVNSMLFVVANETQEKGTGRATVQCLDLTSVKHKDGELAHGLKNVTFASAELFRKHRKTAFNYKCPAVVAEVVASSEKLSHSCEVKQGLATTNNARFIKYWWEVDRAEIGKRWYPYVKGAGSSRWWSPVETVVDWGSDGKDIKQAVAAAYPYLNGKTAWVVKNEEYYFRSGLTFSFVNTKRFAVRELPQGCIFDVAGSALFPHDGLQSFLLAYLNSSLIAAVAQVFNPTVNFQVGDLKELPVVVVKPNQRRRLAEIADRCVELQKTLLRFDNRAVEYKAPAEFHLLMEGYAPKDVLARILANDDSNARLLRDLEREIDEIVLDALRDRISRNERQELITLIEQHSSSESTVGELLVREEWDLAFLFALHIINQNQLMDQNRAMELDRLLEQSPLNEHDKALHSVPSAVWQWLTDTFDHRHRDWENRLDRHYRNRTPSAVIRDMEKLMEAGLDPKPKHLNPKRVR